MSFIRYPIIARRAADGILAEFTETYAPAWEEGRARNEKGPALPGPCIQLLSDCQSLIWSAWIAVRAMV